MSDLRTMLDDLVVGAPVEDQDWSDVVARAQRRTTEARRGVVRQRLRPAWLLLVVLATLAIAGTAVGVTLGLRRQQEEFHANLPNDPRRDGPMVEITSGDEWALFAWNSDVGVCLDFAVPGNSPFGCDFPVRGAKSPTDRSGSGLPTHAVAGMLAGSNLKGGDGKATVFGIAASDVATVSVEFRNGRRVPASMFPAPPELGANVQFFISRLDLGVLEHGFANPVRAYLAYDASGRLVERFED